MGLLAVIHAMLAQWAYYLYQFPFPFVFPYCWASSVVRLLVKNGPQHWSYCVRYSLFIVSV